jgi:hypothetical protein
VALREPAPSKTEQTRIHRAAGKLAEPHWLTRAQAAAALEVHARTLDRYIREHRVTVYRGPIGINLKRRVLVWGKDVEKLAASA